MAMLAEADFVVSDTDVAVTVIVAGVGGAAGAVKVVAVALGVDAGLKLPHWALPQVTVQVTPAFALSLLTVAVNAAVFVAATDAGGVVSATEIGALGAEMVIVAQADLVVSLTAVAVTVTVADFVAGVGALYLVAAPLAVDAAEKVPHGAALQVTAHVTPAFALSLLTAAVRLELVPASSEDGGWGENDTEICAGGLGEEPEPPQPVMINAKTKATMSQARQRDFISHLLEDWFWIQQPVHASESRSRVHCAASSVHRRP
jgi:hypothetical protein